MDINVILIIVSFIFLFRIISIIFAISISLFLFLPGFQLFLLFYLPPYPMLCSLYLWRFMSIPGSCSHCGGLCCSLGECEYGRITNSHWCIRYMITWCSDYLRKDIYFEQQVHSILKASTTLIRGAGMRVESQ